MVRSLEGRTALITAAGQGIGYATALAFVDVGARVIATDISPKGLEKLASERPSISTHRLDVTDFTAIATLLNELDRVDVLFNCVGYVHNGSILECEERDWKRSFDLNVTSMFRTCRAVLPGMIARKQGSIINVASVVSSAKGAPKRFAYGTSKAAVVGLTKSIAADFVQSGIRCNALCPGIIETPSLEERMAAAGDLDAARKTFIARQPMGRLGIPLTRGKIAIEIEYAEIWFRRIEVKYLV